uniref:rhomboid protease n=1 Tax=Labrus bergylta TaxID=56723 RepID=A0A3Q3E5D9_9LABR
WLSLSPKVQDIIKCIQMLSVQALGKENLTLQTYDPDSSGFISTERFRDLLATHGSELDPHKLEVLLALADGNADGKICYQDFVNLVSLTQASLAVLAAT